MLHLIFHVRHTTRALLHLTRTSTLTPSLTTTSGGYLPCEEGDHDGDEGRNLIVEERNGGLLEIVSGHLSRFLDYSVSSLGIAAYRGLTRMARRPQHVTEVSWREILERCSVQYVVNRIDTKYVILCWSCRIHMVLYQAIVCRQIFFVARLAVRRCRATTCQVCMLRHHKKRRNEAARPIQQSLRWQHACVNDTFSYTFLYYSSGSCSRALEL